MFGYPDTYNMIEDEYYDEKIDSYREEAQKKVSKHLNNPFYSRFYAEAMALAFFEGIDDSTIICDELGIKYIHVYALLDMRDRFIKELNEMKEL